MAEESVRPGRGQRPRRSGRVCTPSNRVPGGGRLLAWISKPERALLASNAPGADMTAIRYPNENAIVHFIDTILFWDPPRSPRRVVGTQSGWIRTMLMQLYLHTESKSSMASFPAGTPRVDTGRGADARRRGPARRLVGRKLFLLL